MVVDTSLYACPTCDCLFVATSTPTGARCPICKGVSPYPGRAWLEARRSSAADLRLFGETSGEDTVGAELR